MQLKKGYQTLLAEAQAKIRTVDVAEAKQRFGSSDVVFVDLRDPRELEREGMIPDALHAPRGMLEFWVDPDSPYYRDVFGSGKEFILYCQAGWRSALAAATLEEMGLPRVAHLEGGYQAWKDGGGATAEKPVRAKS